MKHAILVAFAARLALFWRHREARRLVIGNAAYQNTQPLANPRNDASDLPDAGGRNRMGPPAAPVPLKPSGCDAPQKCPRRLQSDKNESPITSKSLLSKVSGRGGGGPKNPPPFQTPHRE